MVVPRVAVHTRVTDSTWLIDATVTREEHTRCARDRRSDDQCESEKLRSRCALAGVRCGHRYFSASFTYLPHRESSDPLSGAARIGRSVLELLISAEYESDLLHDFFPQHLLDVDLEVPWSDRIGLAIDNPADSNPSDRIPRCAGLDRSMSVKTCLEFGKFTVVLVSPSGSFDFRLQSAA